MTDKQELEAPDIVAVLPLRETVLFPQAVLPLSAGRASSVRLVEEAVRASRLIGVVTQRDSAEEDPGADGLYPIGVLARIHKAAKQADGTVRLVVQGISRFRLVEVLEDKPFLRARVQPVADPSDAASDVESQALMRNAMALFRKVVALSPLLPDEAANLPVNILHPGTGEAVHVEHWTNASEQAQLVAKAIATPSADGGFAPVPKLRLPSGSAIAMRVDPLEPTAVRASCTFSWMSSSHCVNRADAVSRLSCRMSSSVGNSASISSLSIRPRTS